MDFDEWELLPEGAGYLDFPEDEEKKPKPKPGTKTVFNMNYFLCPPSSPNSSVPNPNQQLVPVSIPIPIQLETTTKTTTGLENYKKAPEDEQLVKEISRLSTSTHETLVLPSVENIKSLEAEQDIVSRVFFNKMKENEFVDMKMDSPKSPTTSRGFVPQIDASTYHFDDNKSEDCMESNISPRMKLFEKKMNNKEEEEEEEEEENIINSSDGLNMWKWSFTGIGAICSFGIAAATICILFFGGHQVNKHQHNQKLTFQIYTNDKRIKQVVHHATKFNEAISAARGVPLPTTRSAHITCGGYYDGL